MTPLSRLPHLKEVKRGARLPLQNYLYWGRQEQKFSPLTHLLSFGGQAREMVKGLKLGHSL
jgi:hypothetical protein